MIFIILFPTLASAMSGYDANVAAYMPDTNRNFLPFKGFKRIVYVIHDGNRIGENEPYWITDVDTSYYYYWDSGMPVVRPFTLEENEN